MKKPPKDQSAPASKTLWFVINDSLKKENKVFTENMYAKV